VADAPDPRDSEHVELELEPTIAGRVTRSVERIRILKRRADAARAHHASVDLGFTLIERDSSIGGGLLAGALAYRLFVLLLPVSLLLVSGLGIYAGAVDESRTTVARRAGLHGVIGSEIAQTAGSHSRAIVFLLMIPAVIYALVALYRALAKIHAIIWLGSGRGVRITTAGVVVLCAAATMQLAAWEIVRWIQRVTGDWAAPLAYVVLIGAAWFAVSLCLPHGTARWFTLLPGAVLFGVGLLLITIFNTYVTTLIVQGRANTYGALGIAAALLFSLLLVGRLMVVSGELNASLSERRHK
jgi:membrane protein